MTNIRINSPVNADIDVPAEDGSWESPSDSFSRGPRATVRVKDPDGTITAQVTPGLRLNLTRGPTAVFEGVVEKRNRSRGAKGEVLVDFTLRQRTYHALRNAPCDPYIYDEDGDPATARDAVRVNSWHWFVFRKPESASLDADGNTDPVDGVTLDDAFTALVGPLFIQQANYEDNRWFRASDINGTPGTQAQVYQDQGEDDRPALSRVRGTGGYQQQTAWLRSIRLSNGEPLAGEMGEVQSAKVFFIGEKNGSDDLTVQFCRDADEAAPHWLNATVTHHANWNGSGLDAWEADVGAAAFAADGSTQKTRFGFRLKVQGTSPTASTRVFYHRVRAVTKSDTNVALGSVDAYYDPHGLTLDAVWVDDDFEGMTRAAAIERIRKTTVGDPTVNPSPHWDVWADGNLTASFKARRGADLDDALDPIYDVDDGNITVLDFDENAEHLIYQVIALGGGRGSGQFVITDRTEFTSGGLYSSAHDPSDGATHSIGPGVAVYKDTSAQTRGDLRRRARAFLAAHLDPKPFYKVQVIGWQDIPFAVGDGIQVRDTVLGVDEVIRVKNISERFSGRSGHVLDIELGERIPRPDEVLANDANANSRDKSVGIKQPQKGGFSSPGIYCDATHFGVGTFAIPDGVEVERVILDIQTVPWQIQARGGEVHEFDVITSTSDDHEHSAGVVNSAGGSGNTTLVGTQSADSINGACTNTAVTTGSWADAGGSMAGGTDTGDWAMVEAVSWNDSDTQHFWRMRVKVTHGGGTTYYPSTSGVTANCPDGGLTTDSVAMSICQVAVPLGVLSGAVSMQVEVQSTGGGAGSFTDRFCTSATLVERHLHDRLSHGHVIDIDPSGAHAHDITIPSHSHPLIFGIWQFDSDTGNGDGDPLYGSGIQLAMDPTLGANGLPTNFAAEALPFVFGSTTSPVRLRLDVTNQLRQTTDGRTAPGLHEVFFKPGTASGNSKGLAVVAMTATVITAQG